MSGLRITRIDVHPTSFPVSGGVTLGIGRAVKRDCVIVEIETADGIVGWGEAHHGRCPGAISTLIATTLKDMVLGMDAADVVGIWSKIYSKQLASHGMGAACVMAMSGIDLALWDIRGKAAGWPLYKLLGGSKRSIPAYAGGISLGFQPVSELVEEAQKLAAQGYKAVKLRFGDSVYRDIERLVAIRDVFGGDLEIMVDANTAYGVEQVRRVMPALVEFEVLWLEEPFPPHDYRSYREARSFGGVPIAAGENHYTRFEFERVFADGVVRIVQPDLSKTGGITEAMRIAAHASTFKLPVNPHTSASGLNMAASIHFLSAIENGGYFEADVAKENLFRDRLSNRPDLLDENGCVTPSDKPGLGIEIDKAFLKAHPLIDGPAYV